MTQKVYILPTSMKCPACKEISKELYKSFTGRGAGRCPHCGTVIVDSVKGRVKNKSMCN